MLLRERGYDARNARDLGLSVASDVTILDTAVRDQRIIATLDSDFGTLIALRRLAAPSIIFVRIADPKAEEACELIDSICRRFREQLLAGCIVTVESDSIRVRKLPILGGR